MKNIAFDFDFTLADTSEAIIGGLEVAFELAKIQPKLNIRENFSKIIGLKLDEQLNELSPNEVTKIEFKKLKNIFMDFYRSQGISMTIAYSGAIDLFDYLIFQQFNIHVISAKSTVNLGLSLNYLNLNPTKFTGGISLDDKVLYLDSSKCTTYVGDMEIDVKISRKANCKSIILKDSIDEISKWEFQPDFHFNSPSEFLTWIKQEENLLSL